MHLIIFYYLLHAVTNIVFDGETTAVYSCMEVSAIFNWNLQWSKRVSHTDLYIYLVENPLISLCV
jgi:hypothetical protein